jgi:hypothetical protein
LAENLLASRSVVCNSITRDKGDADEIHIIASARSFNGCRIAHSASSGAGCLKGAAVGGVAGHYAGHHGALGAAAGCVIGHHEATKHAREKAQPQQSQ